MISFKKTSRWRAYSETDATAWINITDTMNDMILFSLFTHDKVNIGNYTIGNIGSILNTNSRFSKRYPQLFDAVKVIHDARLSSDLSHPIVRQTNQPTRWIPFKSMKYFKQKLKNGYLEMWATLGIN